MQSQFLQFTADNIDHNTQTLVGLNTFHGMGMIKAVSPGIKCTSRIIPCVEVTAEDVAAVAKIDILFYKNVERFNIKYEKLPEISKMIILGRLIYLWSYHICFTLQLQSGMVLCNWVIMGNVITILQ